MRSSNYFLELEYYEEKNEIVYKSDSCILKPGFEF